MTTAEISHIKFTWSPDAMTTILDDLHVRGLGAYAKATGLHAAWPGKEQWSPYTEKLRRRMRASLGHAETDALEHRLSAVETAFNAYLHHEGGDAGHRASELNRILDNLEEIESLVCNHTSYGTYPYFARWFTLHLEALRVLAMHKSTAGQVRGLRRWWNARRYLERVLQVASDARASEVRICATGSHGDRMYVRDEATGQPLTKEAAIGSEERIALLDLRELLASEASWQYVEDLSIEDGFKILEQARNALTVTADSPTPQDSVLDASKFWREQREVSEHHINELRKKCGKALDLLVVHGPAPRAAAPRNTVPTERPLTAAEKQAIEKFIASYKPAVVSTGITPAEQEQLEKEFPSAIEIVGAVVPNLIGMIPVVGDVLGPLYGLYFMFMGPLLQRPKPNPWVEFEKKMQKMIKEEIAIFDFRAVSAELAACDELFKSFINDYHRESNKEGGLTEKEQGLFFARVADLLTEINKIKVKIINPASQSYLKVAPCYEHCFLLYIAILALAERLEVPTYHYAELRSALYKDTLTFVDRAFWGIRDERAADIRIVDISDCGNPGKYRAVDDRMNVNLGESLNMAYSWVQNSMRESCKAAVGLVAAMQLLRQVAIRTHAVIGRDTTAVKPKPSIREHFNECVRIQHGNLQTNMAPMVNSSWLKPFWHEDLTLLNDPRYVEPRGDVGFRVLPPSTVMHFETTYEVGAYYAFVCKAGYKNLTTGGGAQNMTNVFQASTFSGEHQQWSLCEAGGGYFYIVNRRFSDLVVAVDVNAVTSKDNVVVYTKITAAEDQKWKLVPAESGYYYIVNKQQSSKNLDVKDANPNDQANVQVWPKNTTNAQKWCLSPA